MKKIISFIVLTLVLVKISAQIPNSFTYQAVVRNADNSLVTETSVGIQISIIQGTANGTAVYVETQTPITNGFGLIAIEIGGDAATIVSGSISGIDWSTGNYFIKTEIDPAGGTSFTITGTSQLLSVPYALYAETAGNMPNIKDSIDAYLSVTPQSLAIAIAQGADVQSLINSTVFTLSDLYNAGVSVASLLDYGVTFDSLENAGISIHGAEGSLNDIDGNTYAWIGIGDQIWMAENLRTTRFNDGEAIYNETDNNAWNALTIPGYCWYDNDSATYAETYGALYNGHAVETAKLCPEGWHVPSQDEFMTLFHFLGDNGYSYDSSVGDSTQSIAKALAVPAAEWSASATEGAVGNNDYAQYQNKSLFSGVPAGGRYNSGPSSGIFGGFGTNGYYRSTTIAVTSNPVIVAISYNSPSATVSTSYSIKYGLSVRCIKD